MGFFSKLIDIVTACFFLWVEVLHYWWNKFISSIIKPTSKEILLTRLSNAETYEEYSEIAIHLDRLLDNEVWKSNPINRYYDHQLIYRRLKYINQIHKKNDLLEMMDFLRSGVLRNLGGMNDPKLYSYCYSGTKNLISEYIQEVSSQIVRISQATPEELSPQVKMDFLHDFRMAFGNTALILHGGATFAIAHVGVIKALFEQSLLPKIICGTQIGALIAALVCIHTDEELPLFLTPDGINLKAFAQNKPIGTTWRKVLRLFKTGHLLDIRILERCVYSNTGDITFEEAFFKTGRILNISVSPLRKNEVPQLLNYLTAPNVLIRSAAIKSAAISGLYDTVDLLIKNEYGEIVPLSSSTIKRTNSLTSELETPISRLSELFNVNHFIVSQASPYIAPFITKGFQLQDDSFTSRIRNVIVSELLHRAQQLDHFGLLPRLLRGVVDQTFSGDVTIFPSVSLTDYNNLFSNPTPELVHYWALKGMQSTFPMMELIRNRCEVELIVESAYKALKNKEPHRAPHVDSILPQRSEVKRTRSIH
ncbi:hypothetical protein K502DRAFT_326188 [Neoconidiobolus thromboides FSU 785]|nr:hypothetical protein K502DRAFT_326188 [Neoconidiobolus thromboides FSU 785]